MRIAQSIVGMATALAGLWLSAPSSARAEEALSTGAIQLELPELGTQKYAPGILRVPEPENIRRLVLHIPLPRIHKAFPKINAIGTGLTQTIRVRQDEVLCDIDLAVNQGRYYALNAMDNTIEIKVVPKPGADPLYAKWVIAPPKEPPTRRGHRRQPRRAGGAGRRRA